MLYIKMDARDVDLGISMQNQGQTQEIYQPSKGVEGAAVNAKRCQPLGHWSSHMRGSVGVKHGHESKRTWQGIDVPKQGEAWL